MSRASGSGAGTARKTGLSGAGVLMPLHAAPHAPQLGQLTSREPALERTRFLDELSRAVPGGRNAPLCRLALGEQPRSAAAERDDRLDLRCTGVFHAEVP